MVPPHPLASLATSPQPKSDISDLGQLIVPNSGKPEFERGEVNRVLGTLGEDLPHNERFARRAAVSVTSPRRGEVGAEGAG
jgi:hypothetical protein